jgi:putative phage-type endonuclease
VSDSESRREWLESRRAGIGASDVPAIVGESRWGSPFSVWASKVGLVPIDDEQTDAQTLGHDLEPVIANWFHRRTGLHVFGQQSLVAHPASPHHMATLDGYVEESVAAGIARNLGVFEAKSTAERWDVLPEYVAVQVQWQMHVTGSQHTWVGAMQFPYGRVRFDVFEVERDDARIAELVTAVDHFWTTYVLTGDMPPVDDHPATAAAIDAAWGDLPTAAGQGVPTVIFDYQSDLIDEFKALTIEHSAVEKRLKAIKTRIKAHFAETDPALSEGTIGGQTVVSWRAQGRTDIDTTRVRQDHGDRYDRHSTIRVLRPHTPKATARRDQPTEVHEGWTSEDQT